KYTETVTGFTPVGLFGAPQAAFKTTGVGTLEFYFSGINADDLTGSGFNDGRLIALLTGVGNSVGTFAITDVTPVAMDEFGVDNYPGQTTVSGIGAQG